VVLGNKSIGRRVWSEGLSVSPATSKFEAAVLENLDAAHNLARWLMRNDQDAQDVVQESCMKALRAFDSLRGGDFRPWFLSIVRNTSFTLLHRSRGSQGPAGAHSLESDAEIPADETIYDPQVIAIRAADADCVRAGIDQLPVVLREAIVLREIEGLSYKEIGKVAGVPIGTVMSRLARGRRQLQALLAGMNPLDARENAQEARDELR
jgi:RNA polymerase sigma-70 factor (ECF subfamily)